MARVPIDIDGGDLLADTIDESVIGYTVLSVMYAGPAPRDVEAKPIGVVLQGPQGDLVTVERESLVDGLGLWGSTS